MSPKTMPRAPNASSATPPECRSRSLTRGDATRRAAPSIERPRAFALARSGAYERPGSAAEQFGDRRGGTSFLDRDDLPAARGQDEASDERLVDPHREFDLCRQGGA